MFDFTSRIAWPEPASIPVSVTRQIADTMRKATFVVLEGASHFGAYESPEVFIPLFEEFIDSWSPCRPRQTLTLAALRLENQ